MQRAQLPLLLLWVAGLLGSAAGLGSVWGGRSLAQQRQEQEQEGGPLANLAPLQPIEAYKQVQGTTNDTLLVYRLDGVIRLLGDRFVPLSPEDQLLLCNASRELSPSPVILNSYREFYPDPDAPEAIRDAAPGVEISLSAYWIIPPADLQVVNDTKWGQLSVAAGQLFRLWGMRLLTLGLGSEPPKLVSTSMTSEPDYLWNSPGPLHPIIVFNVSLSITLADDPGPLTMNQTSVVSMAVEAAVLERIGTLVQVINRTHAAVQGGLQHMLLEVTMFMCRDNATVLSPACEQQILEFVLNQMLQSARAQQQWQAQGIKTVELGTVSQRLPPPPPPATTNTSMAAGNQQKPWVPWHLDRINQRGLPLDGGYTANATGGSVHVYIVSSGVRADHEEFQYMGGRPWSRVEGEWGYLGLDPQKDCDDSSDWVGYGTFAASLCCGLKLGVAKNATIHSVRFREHCQRDGNESLWGEGALPSALDAVLSKVARPAVVLIDMWWAPGQSVSRPSAAISRLQRFFDHNITVVAPVGAGRNVVPCENPISSHPAVISVGASDIHDEHVAFSPRGDSCVDIWAPSGGVGTGLQGADPATNASYTLIINWSFGAAALVAGVVAQYLQQNPSATPAQVRRALVEEMATPNVVTGAGAATSRLLFTNLTQPLVEEQPASRASSGSGSGGGLSIGAIAGIATAATIVAIVMAAGFVLRSRRKQRLQSAELKSVQSTSTGWEIHPSDIEICRRPDGSEWLLGEGRYGKVYKALKGGVQPVAVKKMADVRKDTKALFLKEIDMMKCISRDANIVQFFGTSVHGGELMHVAEYMEGGDLRQALSSSNMGGLQWWRQGKDCMLSTVRGVHFLHASNVIHRDIKSKNILLDRNRHAKLADVGLAQLLGSDDEQSPTRGFVGTLAWAAPEMLSGEKYTNKVDIYSLGVLLWEVVTGEVPRRGCLRDPEVPRECPQAVADAIAACMQRDPDLRPTAKELYSMLLACPPEQQQGSAAVMPSPFGGSQAGSSPRSSSSSGGLTAEERGIPRIKSHTSIASALNASASPLSSTASGDGSMVTLEYNAINWCLNPDGSKAELGEGGFGKVYKVLLDGVQPMAAKTIPLREDPLSRAAFLREATLLWRLRHANVVSLCGVSIHEGQGFLLMELMEGGPLSKLLNILVKATRQRLFSWANRRKNIALDVALALHFLHSLKITHMDVKCSNVLLNKHLIGAKLADVGLARVLTCTHHSLSHENNVGTWAYMAPELMGGERCTEKVDIYSYGLLLYELCKGEQPIRGRMDPLRVPEDCPQAVVDLYRQCTALDPAARPSARELVQRLTLAMQATEAPLPGVPLSQ